MEIRRKCIQCEQEFTITDEEQAYYKNKRYQLPKRCKSCRKSNRDEEQLMTDEWTHVIVEQELERRRLRAQSVKHKHFDAPLGHDVKNLFLIGNGFDIWQGLPTQYACFEKFYERHKIDISWGLGIEPIELFDQSGRLAEVLTQFDLLYFILSEFYPTERDDDTDFWSDFENSLYELDDVRINEHFGKEIDDLKDIRLDCDYAHDVIRKCFVEWTKSIKIPPANLGYRFADSLFINFNYTDTLVKRFGVDRNDIIPIHGTADDPDSIVFGHGKKAPYADPFIMQFGARFTGGYMVASILQKFYKKPEVQWRQLRQRLKNKQTDFTRVENIYILGHSLGKADRYYFKQLHKALPAQAVWHFSYHSDKDRKRAEEFCREYKLQNTRLYPSVDSALMQFAIGVL